MPDRAELPDIAAQEACWRSCFSGLSDRLKEIVARWQSAPSGVLLRWQWHLVVAVDGEPVTVHSFSELSELVQFARSLRRLEDRWTQIFCFYGVRFLHDRGPGRCLILSSRRRVPLVPLDCRRDLEADPDGFFIRWDEGGREPPVDQTSEI